MIVTNDMAILSYKEASWIAHSLPDKKEYEKLNIGKETGEIIAELKHKVRGIEFKRTSRMEYC